jgi:N-acetylmuramoyl-L-alanine amidase
VIGHSDMAPARKCDPGPRFDWRRLARQGLSVWPEVAPRKKAPVRDFWTEARLLRCAEALRTFGYAVPKGQPAPACLLTAFGARFPGLGCGPVMLDAAEDLAARFPVDRAPASA